MTIPDVTIGKQLNYGNKYRFTLFNETVFQLIFYHDIRIEDKYFTPENVRHYFGKYMYSILSDLEIESNYKINNLYEFILHYPQLSGKNYNWWRQSLSPTVQTENKTQNGENDHYVLGYEPCDVHYTSNNWGGLSLTNNSPNPSYINGDINRGYWNYAIGCYGVEKGIPGNGIYYKWVALYARINNLDMIQCISCKVYRGLLFDSKLLMFVFILM